MAGESARESARRQREKAERLQRSADLWDRGADGEQRTAELLRELPIEWTVFHDLHWPGREFANVDHIVVGPPGVFVIDSKNWSGTILVKDDVLRQNGRQREREVAGAAEAAMAVSRLAGVSQPDMVQPVLCFVGERALSGWARDVMVTSSDTLLSMLLSRPTRLSPAELTKVRLALLSGLRPARGFRGPRATASRPSRTRPGPRAASTASRGRKASHKRAGGALSSVAVVGALLTFLYVPGVQTAVTDAVTRLIVDTPSQGNTPPPSPKKVSRDRHHRHADSKR